MGNQLVMQPKGSNPLIKKRKKGGTSGLNEMEVISVKQGSSGSNPVTAQQTFRREKGRWAGKNGIRTTEKSARSRNSNRGEVLPGTVPEKSISEWRGMNP